MKLMVYKSKAVIDPESIQDYKEFKDLQKVKKGDECLLYVFLSCDLSWDNPILEIPFTDKEFEAKLLAFGDGKYDIEQKLGPKTRVMVEEACAVYRKEIVLDEQKDIAAYDRKMDQFLEMLKNTVPTIEKNTSGESGVVSYSTNIEIINGVLQDIVVMIQSKSSLIAMMVQGTVPKNLRGGLSPLTLGRFKKKPQE